MNAITERRITLRMLSYWERLRKERLMPAERDIDPDDISDLWDNCFLIHVKDLQMTDYNYTYLGQNIINAYTHGLNDVDANGITSPNATKLAMSFGKVLETYKPLIEEGEFLNASQERVKYRQCLLPLGDDGQIDAILGGMNFKIFEQGGRDE